jgi:predicted  nucleic acid-binding Zn-ribbon protein
MAPLDNLHARDLAWISDFVMQQVTIMMHPVMEHLDQAEDAADCTQRSVERVSKEVSDLRSDLERTNKCLTIMRQGLGLQNESKCALQRTVESTTQTIGRLDDSISQLTSELRGVGVRNFELAKQASESSASIEDLWSKIESLTLESHALKDGLRNSEARLEVWQQDLRELRRNQMGIAPKFEEKLARHQTSSQSNRGGAAMDPWSQKKSMASTTPFEMYGKECSTPERDGDSKQKRLSHVNTASQRSLLQPELRLSNLPSRGSSQAVLYEHAGCIAPESEDSHFGSHPSSAYGDETIGSSRLPLLAKQSNSSRPNDSMYANSVRLRFSETLTRQPSRGSLN